MLDQVRRDSAYRDQQHRHGHDADDFDPNFPHDDYQHIRLEHEAMRAGEESDQQLLDAGRHKRDERDEHQPHGGEHEDIADLLGLGDIALFQRVVGFALSRIFGF